MNKQYILKIIKQIKEKFDENGIYKGCEYRKTIYDVLNNFNEETKENDILEYLDRIVKVLQINDKDILYVIRVLGIEEKLEELKYKKINENGYTKDDLVLIRSTNFLPNNRVVPSISNVPFVNKNYLIEYNAIYRLYEENDIILKEIESQMKNINLDDYEESSRLYNEKLKRQEELKNIALMLTPYSTSYRTTTHFCLNGLVKDHSKGTFDGKFIIVEPFKHHINDENLLSVRPEDTYFKDGISLSDDAIILVDEKHKEEIHQWEEFVNYKIRFYSGDKYVAVRCLLIELGIVPEEIAEHNIEESKTSRLVNDFIKNNTIGGVSHFNSQSRIEDNYREWELNRMYEIEFFNYLSNFIIDTNQKDKLSYLSNENPFNELALEDLLVNIIRNIGIEEYKNIVDGFNNIILEKIKANEYPTNNEILQAGSLNIVGIDKTK